MTEPTDPATERQSLPAAELHKSTQAIRALIATLGLALCLLVLLAIQFVPFVRWVERGIATAIAFNDEAEESDAPYVAPGPDADEPAKIPEPAVALRIAGTGIADIFTPDDYPLEALRREEEGVITFELRIDPAGRPRRCLILKSAGNGLLERTTCRIAMRRLHFEPARDAAGQPIWAKISRRIIWKIPE